MLVFLVFVEAPEVIKALGKLEGLIYMGGPQTPDFYKGFTIGNVTNFLKSFTEDFVEGLGLDTLVAKQFAQNYLVSGCSQVLLTCCKHLIDIF